MIRRFLSGSPVCLGLLLDPVFAIFILFFYSPVKSTLQLCLQREADISWSLGSPSSAAVKK